MSDRKIMTFPHCEFLYLFQEKIKTTPLTICFTDYTGAQEYHPCIQYMARKFKEQKKSGPQAYCHLTCLTDTNNMRFVINAVTDLLIKNFLKDCGIYWMNQMYICARKYNELHLEVLARYSYFQSTFIQNLDSVANSTYSWMLRVYSPA